MEIIKFVKNKPSTLTYHSIISSGTILEGNIHATSGLRIDGSLFGNIVADQGEQSPIAVGPEGKIEGNLKGQRIIIAGTVIGDICCEGLLELLPGAHILGDIQYNAVAIGLNAQISGTMSQLSPSSAIPAAKEISQDLAELA
jgi:cytoskeletal protein CcmA (bactofilin family)